MNEVEKMYENAGVKYYKEICAIKNVIDKISNSECYFEVSCTSCPFNKTSFTAEKQIEITKFLISKYARFKKFRSYEQKDLYMVYYECRYYPKQYLPFGEALAESINYLWQDLTEEERKQIKEILE